LGVILYFVAAGRQKGGFAELCGGGIRGTSTKNFYGKCPAALRTPEYSAMLFKANYPVFRNETGWSLMSDMPLAWI
jgi:hypothetical protein